MIMGYADRIAADKTASEGVKEQAVIVQKQSAKIKRTRAGFEFSIAVGIWDAAAS